MYLTVSPSGSTLLFRTLEAFPIIKFCTFQIKDLFVKEFETFFEVFLVWLEGRIPKEEVKVLIGRVGKNPGFF